MTSESSKSNLGLPRSVWALRFVSMFMDISSEMIHALLPIYLVTVLGTSTLTVGFIEGIAEATANITKIFSYYHAFVFIYYNVNQTGVHLRAFYIHCVPFRLVQCCAHFHCQHGKSI
jgi:hypothetical protein